MKTNNTRMTLTDARHYPSLFLSTMLDWKQFKTSRSEVNALVTWFQWLCGMNEKTDPELLEAARCDVVGDVDLAIMLGTEPDDFREWFQEDDWGIYELTIVTGSEDWAQTVLRRCGGHVPTR